MATMFNRHAHDMKKWAIRLMLSLSVAWALPVQARYAALVVDADTGTVLHSVEATARWYPASLTKMMTLYLTFEALDRGQLRLDETLTASAHAESMPSSELGLAQGDRIVLRDALLGVIIRSANDAAVVLAERLGGSESAFAETMTAKARSLGMVNTTFRNASGMSDPQQVTTAHDLALLARALRRDFPHRYPLFSTKEFDYKGVTLRSTNALLKSLDGADGLKTGFTCASGFNIVVSAQREGRKLIGIMLGAQNRIARNEKVAQMLNDGFRVDRIQYPAKQLADLSVEANDLPPPYQLSGCGSGTLTASAPSTGWAALLGLFPTRDAAQSALTRARDDPHVARARAVVVSRSKGYAVQFSGLRKDAAAAFCSQVYERKVGCVTASPAMLVRMASAGSENKGRVKHVIGPRHVSSGKSPINKVYRRIGQGG
jgi:D-alanyl-D-alanine carboxypeptidase